MRVFDSAVVILTLSERATTSSDLKLAIGPKYTNESTYNYVRLGVRIRTYVRTLLHTSNPTYYLTCKEHSELSIKKRQEQQEQYDQ